MSDIEANKLAEKLQAALEADGIAGSFLDWSGPGGTEDMIAAMLPVCNAAIRSERERALRDAAGIVSMQVHGDPIYREDFINNAACERIKRAILALIDKPDASINITEKPDAK